MVTNEEIEKGLMFLADTHGYTLVRAVDMGDPDSAVGWAFAKRGYKPTTPAFPTIQGALRDMLERLDSQFNDELVSARARLAVLRTRRSELLILLTPLRKE